MSDIETPRNTTVPDPTRALRAVAEIARPRGAPGIITGPQLRESLAQLITRLGALEAQGEEIVGRLIGAAPETRMNRANPEAPEPEDEPLFPSLARRVVEANRVIERIEATLKRGIDTLT